jgi:hypothetical protein
VALVVMGHCAGTAGLHRQARLSDSTTAWAGGST